MTYKAVHVRIARVTWQMVFGQLQGQEAMGDRLRSMVYLFGEFDHVLVERRQRTGVVRIVRITWRIRG